MVVTKVRAFLVEPIYGWGWTDDAQSIDVPAAFEAQLTCLGGTAEGLIMSGPLAGSIARLSPRHAEWDGYVNIEMLVGERRLTGYAQVPLEVFQ